LPAHICVCPDFYFLIASNVNSQWAERPRESIIYLLNYIYVCALFALARAQWIIMSETAYSNIWAENFCGLVLYIESSGSGEKCTGPKWFILARRFVLQCAKFSIDLCGFQWGRSSRAAFEDEKKWLMTILYGRSRFTRKNQSWVVLISFNV